METKQSLTTVSVGLSTFLSFGAKSVRPDVLEKMLIGRQKTADLLEQYVREIAVNGVNQQVFMVGPRGSGKTHLLRVLYHRMQDLVQSRQVVVSYFAEEEYGISGYLDFLIRIINAFMRWYDTDKAYLSGKLNILRETPESRQEDVAETLISEYVGDKPLLILSENFDNILEALGKQGQAKLRAWLYRHNRISIIATAQAISPDLDREDRPFYGFFTPIYLKKLTYEDSLFLLVTLAETENSQTMLTHLAGKGKSQVRAIHDLVKGNHRLLVTFYEFLKADTLADLSVIFMKTMNDLKPYYETFIRYLPAQQQKILHYLALAKIPQQGTDIGKDCSIPTTSLSKQLSELQRRHLIDAFADPTDKRNKLYDVSEPLLRIAIEIGEQKEGITSLFIDFLALYYSQEEIIEQKNKFEGLYFNEEDLVKKQKLYWEIEARTRALDIKQSFDLKTSNDLTKKIIINLEMNNFDNAISVAEEVALSQRDGNYYFLVGYIYLVQEKYSQSIYNILKAHELNNKNIEFIKHLAVSYSKNSDYRRAIAMYRKAIAIDPNDYQILYNLAIALSADGKSRLAIEAYEKAISIKSNFPEALYNLGKEYAEIKDYSNAINFYKKSLESDPFKREAWFNIGIIHKVLLQYSEAIEAYQNALLIKSENSVKNNEIWNNIGNVYLEKLEYDKAESAYKMAIQYNPDDYWAWNNFGVIYLAKNEIVDAIASFKKAILLQTNTHRIWHNLGLAYQLQKDYTQAVFAYKNAYLIDPNQRGTIERLSASIMNCLKNQALTLVELQTLSKWLKEESNFDVILSYVDVFFRINFNGEEKSLYDLPKEQREFFEREILKRTIV